LQGHYGIKFIALICFVVMPSLETMICLFLCQDFFSGKLDSWSYNQHFEIFHSKDIDPFHKFRSAITYANPSRSLEVNTFQLLVLVGGGTGGKTYQQKHGYLTPFRSYSSLQGQ